MADDNTPGLGGLLSGIGSGIGSMLKGITPGDMLMIAGMMGGNTHYGKWGGWAPFQGMAPVGELLNQKRAAAGQREAAKNLAGALGKDPGVTSIPGVAPMLTQISESGNPEHAEIFLPIILSQIAAAQKAKAARNQLKTGPRGIYDPEIKGIIPGTEAPDRWLNISPGGKATNLETGEQYENPKPSALGPYQAEIEKLRARAQYPQLINKGETPAEVEDKAYRRGKGSARAEQEQVAWYRDRGFEPPARLGRSPGQLNEAGLSPKSVEKLTEFDFEKQIENYNKVDKEKFDAATNFRNEATQGIALAESGATGPFQPLKASLTNLLSGIASDDQLRAAADTRSFKAIMNKATMDALGGRLGAQISDADRDFIEQMLALPSDNRMAAVNVLKTLRAMTWRSSAAYQLKGEMLRDRRPLKEMDKTINELTGADIVTHKRIGNNDLFIDDFAADLAKNEGITDPREVMKYWSAVSESAA